MRKLKDKRVCRLLGQLAEKRELVKRLIDKQVTALRNKS